MRNSYILVRKPEGKRPLGDLGVNMRIILKWILKNSGRYEGIDWIQQVQDRVQRRAFVKVGPTVSINDGEMFSPTKQLPAFSGKILLYGVMKSRLF
jgi:hypothetical protein